MSSDHVSRISKELMKNLEKSKSWLFESKGRPCPIISTALVLTDAADESSSLKRLSRLQQGLHLLFCKAHKPAFTYENLINYL